MRTRTAVAAMTLGLLHPVAQATNGYFSHGYGIAQSAMGGAGTALPSDSLIAAINPAGVAWTGDRLDFSLGYFAPRRGYDASERGEDANVGVFTIDPNSSTTVSRNTFYLIPAFGLTRTINDRLSWGVAMYGNGGLNTEYDQGSARFGQGLPGFATQCNGTFGGGAPINGASDALSFCGDANPIAGVDLIQVFIAPSLSMKLGDKSSIGIEPLIAVQRFKATGLEAFARFSNAPDKVTDNGSEFSYGYGGRIGFLTGIIPRVGIGGSYQTRTRMTRFKKYEGLFAEQGSFDIPSTWNVGISLEVTENQRLVYDFQRIHYGEIGSINNRFDTNAFTNNCALPRLLQGSTAPNDACLGASTGPGFGWQDISIHKIGYQLKFAAFTFRAGYSFTDQPIPDSEALFNILAPGVPRRHYTGGVSWQASRKIGFDLNFFYAAPNPVTGKNNLSNSTANALEIAGGGLLGVGDTSDAFGPDANDQDIRINLHEWEARLGLSYRFE